MSVTDEIKLRLDIADFIENYVPLKRSGRNFKGLCPFHAEKTPSFVVFPESQQWRCFGACAEGGDIFTFVQKVEGWDFPEALRFLAERAGVELEPATPAQQEARETRDRLRDLLDEVARFFNRLLLTIPEAEHAYQYVRERGFSDKTVEDWLIGYAPDSWDSTMNFLLEKGYSRDDIVDAGMVVVKDNGSIYDRFRDRLMIPIRDSRGRVVGFGARALAADAVPKYLNSPQSEIFDKSHVLFGLSHARRTIRETETAIIVEGYMDVIQAFQAGYTNVVAEMGTALTDQQLQLLSRYASRLMLALDPDAAGQMATQRGREVIERATKAAAEEVLNQDVWDNEGYGGLDAAERQRRLTVEMGFDARGMLHYESRLGFDIRVIILPEGHDPDDLLREDPDYWQELVDNATPIVEYVIQQTVEGQNLEDPKVKSRVADEIIPLIKDIPDAIERSHYIQRLTRLLKVPENVLFPRQAGRQSGSSRQTRLTSASHVPLQPRSKQISTDFNTPTRSREAFCLAALVRYPRLIYRVNRVLAEFLAPESLAGSLPDEMAPESVPSDDTLAWRVVSGDFSIPEHRNIFLAWMEALDQDELSPQDWLLEFADGVSLDLLYQWLDGSLDSLLREITPPDRELTLENIFEETMRGLLAIRSRRLDDHFLNLTYMLEDEDKGGNASSAELYGERIKALLTAKTRIAKALARFSDAGRRLDTEDNKHIRLRQ